MIFSPTPVYSLTDEPLWIATPGDWYHITLIEGSWALARWENDPPEWLVWIALDERVGSPDG